MYKNYKNSQEKGIKLTFKERFIFERTLILIHRATWAQKDLPKSTKYKNLLQTENKVEEIN